MTLTRVPVKDFRGGLNTRDSPFELSANESPDLLNVTISSLVGQLEQRKGKTRYDVSGLPETEPIDYAKQVVFGSPLNKRYLMLSINGNIYICREDGTVAKIHAGTAGTVWSFELFADAAFKDWVWCSNGIDTPQKWNGEELVTKEWKVTLGGGLPNGSVLKVWEDRMFISAAITSFTERIWFSEFSDPEATVKEYGFVDVRSSEEDLDAVQDLAVLGSRLIVMKQRSIYFISSAVTMANRRIGGPGVWGRFQTVELEDKLYFFNPQGIWSTGGVQVTMESGSINSWFPKHLTKSALSKARLIATRDTYPRLLLAVAIDGGTTPNILIEMVPHINFRRIGGRRYLLLPAFFLHTLPATALANWNPTGEEELIIGADNAAVNKDIMPSLNISDSLERGAALNFKEDPMGAISHTWGQLGAAARLRIVSDVARREATRFFGATKWETSYTNPAVEVEIADLRDPTATGFGAVTYHAAAVVINVCLPAGEEGTDGYELKVFRLKEVRAIGEKSNWYFTLVKYKAKVLSVLTFEELLPKELKVGDRVGLTVVEGKIRVWVNYSGVEWQLVGEAADASFTSGYSGIGLEEFDDAEPEPGKEIKRIGLHNFRAGSIPNTINRLSTFFSGEDDEGSEISAHWHSAWMVLQGEEPKERVRRVNIELQGDAVLDMFTDFSELPKFSQTIPKGTDEGSEYRFERVRPETWGRFHSVKLRTLPGGQPFLVNAMEVVYRGGKQP